MMMIEPKTSDERLFFPLINTLIWVLLLCLLVLLTGCENPQIKFHPYDYSKSQPAYIKNKSGYRMELDHGVNVNKKLPLPY